MKIQIHLVDMYCNGSTISIHIHFIYIHLIGLLTNYQIFWHRYNGRDASNASTDMQDMAHSN